MNAKKTILPVFVLSLACLVNQNALAGTVYQWTDEAGNINFSDVSPEESVITETHEYSINQDRANNIDLERYSIINQVEQMAQWRRQLAEERLAESMLYLEEKRLAQELEISRRNEAIVAEEYAPRSYYYPPYQFSQHRRHGIDVHPRQVHQNPIVNAPSRRNRNIIPRKYGPVHL